MLLGRQEVLPLLGGISRQATLVPAALPLGLLGEFQRSEVGGTDPALVALGLTRLTRQGLMLGIGVVVATAPLGGSTKTGGKMSLMLMLLKPSPLLPLQSLPVPLPALLLEMGVESSLLLFPSQALLMCGMSCPRPRGELSVAVAGGPKKEEPSNGPIPPEGRVGTLSKDPWTRIVAIGPEEGLGVEVASVEVWRWGIHATPPR